MIYWNHLGQLLADHPNDQKHGQTDAQPNARRIIEEGHFRQTPGAPEQPNSRPTHSNLDQIEADEMDVNAIRLTRPDAQARLIERIQTHFPLLWAAQQSGPREQRLLVRIVRANRIRTMAIVLLERVGSNLEPEFYRAKCVSNVAGFAAIAKDFQLIAAESEALFDLVFLVVCQIQVFYSWE